MLSRQGKVAVKYLENFKDYLEDADDGELHIEDFTNERTLQRGVRIRNEHERKVILNIFQNLVNGKSGHQEKHVKIEDEKEGLFCDLVIFFLYFFKFVF